MAFNLREKFVRAAEGKLGCRLPDSYCRAMQANNGGSVIIGSEYWQLHPIFDQSDRKRISRTCNDIVRETEKMQGWYGWPENALAIGANGCGDALVFLRGGSSCGPEIYEWSHETGEISVIADDFSRLRRAD